MGQHKRKRDVLPLFKKTKTRDVTDGTSNTIMAGEGVARPDEQYTANGSTLPFLVPVLG
ncbi:DUF1559 domain-containing protein [Gimesia sp.]|uniref:DUF1559 family PulG-like putative transporter n=1 Tax=Gimesia sp. TaxID=2024833 RepID=UPI003A8E0E42